MEWSLHSPRVFKTGVVYRAETPSYELKPKTVDIYLVLGPSLKTPRGYEGIPQLVYEYQYLDLLTGEVDDFHRDSYFAEVAEPF